MTTPALTTPYRAIFCDLRTDRVFDILPLRDVSLDDYIGKPGSLTGTVPVPDRAIAARARRIAEGRTSVYLERGGDLWWGGVIWTSTLESTDRGVLTLGIQAATFDSYANRRIIRTDLTYTGKEQLELARELWRHLQATAGGDIGVSYGTETSDVLRDVSWRDGDETVYYDALDQLAALDGGFEHHISVFRSPAGERVRQLRLGSPKITTGTTDLVLDMPGSILAYSFPRDATRGGTTARARGDSVNENQAEESRPLYSSEHVAQPLIDAGFPRVDLTADYSSITDIPSLESLAAAELATAQGAVVIPEITIRLDDLVPPALLGRTVRLRITDDWYVEGLDTRYRIIGAKVTPPQRGRPDTADLYLEEV
ncbi:MULTISPECIES: hypothetical protein [unclassified Streptomyces]|uniref:hypothetical protein n=1 Tax=unclassified Streptomyces TaxID=2593676 RepID=UPI002E2A8006|nr:hypothetical protein [Streptomyces sp. NBC_00223]